VVVVVSVTTVVVAGCEVPVSPVVDKGCDDPVNPVAAAPTFLGMVILRTPLVKEALMADALASGGR